VLKSDMSQAEMAKVGREIMEGKGLCLTCHTIGKTGGPFRFPDLAGVDGRAKTRKPGYSDVDYFAETLYEPNAYIVPGFNPGMPTINKPPIGLTDQEILCVIAYLQTLGGTPTVTLQTKHHYNTGTPTAPAAAPEGSAPPAAPGPQGSAPGATPAGTEKGAAPR
jgi:cytochrome c peroxidase